MTPARIATYSQAGAKFGYELIWIMVILTFSFAVVQEMCARLGAATGPGLLDLIRERFGIAWALFAVAIILIANGGITVSEFVGIGAAMELLGVSKYVAVPLGAVTIWYLVIFASYAKGEKIFLLMTLVFFAYPVAAILAHPDWGQVVRGAFILPSRATPHSFSSWLGCSEQPSLLTYKYFSKVLLWKEVSRDGTMGQRGSMLTLAQSSPS